MRDRATWLLGQRQEVDDQGFDTLYRPFFGADIASQRMPAPPFLFDPILRSRTITMLSGEPYAGKTLFCLYLLLHLDLQLPLFGRFKPISNCRCLFIGQDAPTWDYHSQFLKLFYGLNLPNEQSIPLHSLLILNQGMSITSHDFISMVYNAVQLYDINVLYLDTLADFHYFEENSNTEMTLVMRTLKYIRDTFDLSIIFTHHVAKPSALETSANYRARGASKIAGSIDQHIYLSSKLKNNIPSIRISFPKARGIKSSSLASLTTFEINEEIRTDGKEIVRLVAGQPPIEELLLDFLDVSRARSEVESFFAAAHPNATGPKIRSQVSRLLESLKDSHRIHSPSHGVWEKLRG